MTSASMRIAPSPAAAASSCATSSPGPAYSVEACVIADGTTLTGRVTVSASFTVTPGTGSDPGIQRAIFHIGGQYLLTDYESPYTFTLDSARFVDGATTLQVKALMRDGWTSGSASLPVTLSNGVTSPPANTSPFTPSSGTWSGSGPILVAAAGDGASGEAASAAAAGLIKSWNPNLLLYLGDVYENGTPTEFDNWYGDPTGDYGQFRSITNPTVGNHEYAAGPGAPGYFDYWGRIPHEYSYTIGPWHFISLDSTSEFLTPANASAQTDWLASDLAADSSPCTLAYFHHPVFNVGPEGDTPRMMQTWSMLANAGVDIVLNGHDHDYQRWTPLDASGNPSASGTTEFVVGTGGHGILHFVSTDSRLAKGYDDTTSPFPIGALQLSLSNGSAAYRFVRATDGAVLDQGSLTCHNAAPAPTPTPTPSPTPTPTPSPSTTPFTDIGSSIFADDITWLYDAGITDGCTPTLFCPKGTVTRGQMAAFLSRGLDLPSTTKDYFTDDAGSIFQGDINRLAAAGITTGCAATRFCPNGTVTRGQMAAFLARALDLPSATKDYFTDDAGSIFQGDINALAAAGITSGCTPTTFCPTLDVTRGQMAAFLHRALG